MPVLLPNQLDLDTWLSGPLDVALALQRQAPNDALRVVAAGKNRMIYNAERHARWI
jgi:hypothetical protein